jgi:hypothetical protein
MRPSRPLSVIVQPICYRYDNTYVSHTLAKFPDRFAGVARVGASIASCLAPSVLRSLPLVVSLRLCSFGVCASVSPSLAALVFCGFGLSVEGGKQTHISQRATKSTNK